MSGGAAYATHTQDRPRGDGMVAHYAPLVKRIAYHLLTRLPPNVQLDDLVQAGMIGLLEATRNYDASQGASFETYAGIRIRGAILDEIRRNDWAPRSVHRKARRVADVVREIENREGRDARDHEIAAEMGLSLDEYYRLVQEAGGYRVFSLDELNEGEESEPMTTPPHEPFDGLQEESFRHALASAISSLPERERLAMSLYYAEDLNLREIGKVLEITESRVSQIHSQAVLRLRARLGAWLD